MAAQIEAAAITVLRDRARRLWQDYDQISRGAVVPHPVRDCLCAWCSWAREAADVARAAEPILAGLADPS